MVQVTMLESWSLVAVITCVLEIPSCLSAWMVILVVMSEE